LEKFYESVRMRAAGIDNAEGKQRIIIELYDKFFKTAFPKMVEQLGIVYTPVEVVDFIIHSVNDVLQKEFGQTISDENVHVLDPFTGTGTFITRLIQSGLIKKEDLPRKYERELHANEIVLLAYYIADVNIRLNIYKRIAGCNNDEQLEDIQVELIDRFGLLPQASKNLIAQTRIRNHSEALGIRKIDMGNQGGTIEFGETTKVKPETIIGLIQKCPNHYRLEGPTKLRVTQSIEDTQSRLELIQSLLDELASDK